MTATTTSRTPAQIRWPGEEAVRDFAKTSQAGARARLGSVCGSLSALISAALFEQAPERTVLHVTADDAATQKRYRDLRSLLGEERVLLNPALDHGGDDARAFEGWGSLAERVTLLQTDAPAVVVTSIASLLERVPSRSFLAAGSLGVAVGDEIETSSWVRSLAARGHRRVGVVEAPGEFAMRGGILDVFPVGAEWPLRIELFGDEVESLRRFDPIDQRSIGEVQRMTLLAVSVGDYVRARRAPDAGSLLQALASDDPGAPLSIVLENPALITEAALRTRSRGRAEDLLTPEDLERDFSAAVRWELERWSVGEAGSEGAEEDAEEDGAGPAIGLQLDLGAVPAPEPGGNLADELAARLRDGESVLVVCPEERDERGFKARLKEAGLASREGDIAWLTGELTEGFRIRPEGPSVLSAVEVLDRVRHRPLRRSVHSRAAKAAGDQITNLGDLVPGKPVVHVVHGIGRFVGIKTLMQEGVPRDQIVIEYRDKALLYLPVDRIGLVRHYIGPQDKMPPLSKLGGKAWKRKTDKVAQACADLAADLLEIQAARQIQEGTAFPADDDDMEAFETAFPYEETRDQVRAIGEVKEDLQSTVPSDRLICGDVGFGKTEVALRAAFKVAATGKQVAVLAPTTVLAHQHGRTFAKRMRDFPLNIGVLSRFRSKAEQRETIKKLKEGRVDIVIGTHRLLSKDVKFKDLGLVIIDEEQRFGVAHKEALKDVRRTVDVLTLSATPIPRTLHMAISGARDISVIASPPRGRVPVKTRVTRMNEALIEQALKSELERGGQAYVVHDRVSTIDKMASLVRRVVPEAAVGVVHGQMDEKALEQTMLAFVDGDLDVLVATKIIENGLDVPRANTLIVNRADRFGLAELHQLRGRVGRHRIQAHAIFLLPRRGAITEVAEKRLRAIEEYDDLGAGFRIALRDLELRGAGNFLGAQQSGHIADVGYDLYCRLLRKAVADLKEARKRGEAIPSKAAKAPGQSLRDKATGRGRRRRKAAEEPAPQQPRVAQGPKAERAPIDLELETGAVEIALAVPAALPDSYVEDVALKIETYRKLASAEDISELDGLLDELRDRYGPPPASVKVLFAIRALRMAVVRAGVSKIGRFDKVITLHHSDRQLLQAALAPHRERLVWGEQEGVAHLIAIDPDGSDESILDELLATFAAVDPALKACRRRFSPLAQASPTKRRRGSKGARGRIRDKHGGKDKAKGKDKATSGDKRKGRRKPR